MKCVNCGKEIRDGIKFCPFCGTRQPAAAPVEPAAAPVAPTAAPAAQETTAETAQPHKESLSEKAARQYEESQPRPAAPAAPTINIDTGEMKSTLSKLFNDPTAEENLAMVPAAVVAALTLLFNVLFIHQSFSGIIYDAYNKAISVIAGYVGSSSLGGSYFNASSVIGKIEWGASFGFGLLLAALCYAVLILSNYLANKSLGMEGAFTKSSASLIVPEVFCLVGALLSGASPVLGILIFIIGMIICTMSVSNNLKNSTINPWGRVGIVAVFIILVVVVILGAYRSLGSGTLQKILSYLMYH